MIMLTTPLPVSGSVHASKILGASAFAVCSMTTTTREPELTRSIAPPMPFTIFLGMTQFARSPVADTWCRSAAVHA